MTRVLMVYHDADVADIEADELRHLGYEVDRCAGPVGGNPCPVLHGDPCWQVQAADVLVYDTWAAERHGEADLTDALREIHPDIPLVLTASRPSSGHDATGESVGYAPTRESLASAIEAALRAPSVPPEMVHHAHDAVRERHAYHGPRW